MKAEKKKLFDQGKKSRTTTAAAADAAARVKIFNNTSPEVVETK